MNRRGFVISGCSFALCTPIFAAQHRYVPKEGCVPDARTALRVAEAILGAIYGDEQIASERPFKAELRDGVWKARGSLPEGWCGGVAEIDISKKTCEILRVTHGK